MENLSPQQRALIIVSALTAVGNLEVLKKELVATLDDGVSINEIKEALTQLYAYCGFPRSLNAINTFKTIVEERLQNGISDSVGKKIIVENKVADKYEQGRQVLEILTGVKQQKPAPGFGEFAPRIDSFLKEHLFADVFSSDVLSFEQRELVTIAALASMSGIEGQLKAHVTMGMNVGISDKQLQQSFDLIEKFIDTKQANIARNVLAEVLSSK